MMKEIYNILHRGIVPAMGLVTILFTACSGDGSGIGDLFPDGTLPSQDEQEIVTLHGIECNVMPIEYVQDADFSRSSLSFTSTGMAFKWEEGHERLTAFPADAENFGCFELTHIKNDHSAMFYGDGFTLTKGKRYFVVGTSEKFADNSQHAPVGCAFPSRNNLKFVFDKQVQTANNNTEHLGAYDYMVASDICPDADAASLTFSHITTTVRIVLTRDAAESMTPETFKATKFKKLEVYDSEGGYVNPVRTMSMDKCMTTGSFVPTWDAFTPNPSDPRFDITLGTGGAGFTPGEDGKLVVYMQLPPANLVGKKLGFILTDTSDKTYFGEVDGKNLPIGKAVQFNVPVKTTFDYTVTLKVNNLWQLGSKKEELSRATGDPGTDNEFLRPTHLYYFFCAKGEVRQHGSFTALTDASWSPDPLNSNIIVYNDNTNPKTLRFQPTGLDDAADRATVRFYAIAARNAITIPDITDGTTEEKVVKYLTYTYSSQDQMKNLFSTPWASDATFVGSLTRPAQDVTLYHTAARLDLKWNSSSILTDNISVNNFQSEMLSMFMPTRNGTKDTEAGYDYTSVSKQTASATLGEDEIYNGRWYFYVPQMEECQYNVTIGGNTNDVLFTPAVTNGFTSWLRWLKQY